MQNSDSVAVLLKIVGRIQEMDSTFELQNRDLLDVLWLAHAMSGGTEANRKASSIIEMEPDAPAAATTPLASVAPGSTTKTRENELPVDTGSTFDSFDSTPISIYTAHVAETNTNRIPTLPLRAPGTTALPDSLRIARALRPLMRRMPSRTTATMDEVATAERFADEGILEPVWKADVTRWLDLALVIDRGGTMHAWSKSIGELRNVFERHGAFGRVRAWNVSDDSGHLQVHTWSRRARGATLRELVDLSRRQLVVIVSDCVSDAWTDGRMARLLAIWAAHGPVVLLNVLPDRLWSRTGLRYATPALLRATAPAMSTTELLAITEDPMFRMDDDETLKLPVATLDGTTLSEAAHLIAASGGAISRGVALPMDFPAHELEVLMNRKQELRRASPQERVKYFDNRASQAARKLARLFAAAPYPLVEPVMRLIQRKVLRDTDPATIAEVLLVGGLMQPVAGGMPEQACYDFTEPALRDALLADANRTDLIDVLTTDVSSHVGEHFCSTIDFGALIGDPAGVEDLQISEAQQPFALIGAGVLHRLGGRYREIGAQLRRRAGDSRAYEAPHDHPIDESIDLPDSILQRPLQEVLRYYADVRDSMQGLQDLRLVVLGRSNAGKTTLIKRLVGAWVDENESETHAISIRELILHCSKGPVKVHAWDFGGQEILHSTHQFFLSERSLYLLVLEPRTGLAQRDAEYWLKLIETQGAGSPTIVVLNWSDQRPWRIDEVKLRRKYPFIVTFLSTDAMTNRGIGELRREMEHTANEMPDVWRPFPKRWREIKDAVAGMRENFLTYTQYTTLCEKYRETRPEAQADLAGILHALGLVLYFGKDPRLHDTRVLNPGWVTGGVYAVICAPSVAQNDGQLSVQDMPRILREAEDQYAIRASDYPKETHAFILELMRAFELCHATDDENDGPARYLVPELLPQFEPSMPEPWETGDVRLRYRYELLPPGLLQRLIVRTYTLSEGAPRWRHGVVLRHADAKGLIREESDRSELEIFALGGSVETRRVLVFIIRRELEALHAEMRIRPLEEIELSGGGQWVSVKTLRDLEETGIETQRLAVQPEGVADVAVTRELDKILPPEARAVDRDPTTAPIPVRLFVSYAREDERQLKRLDVILDLLEQQQGVTSWREKRLIAGEEWDTDIRRRLEEMDIFLFIASQFALVSRYIRDTELRRAAERHAAGEVEIVTVKLEPCAVDDNRFLGKFQRLAPKFKSVTEHSPRSGVWEEVRKDLLKVIEHVRRKKRNSAPRSV